jgi:GTPase SAR1 family protein
LAKLSWLHLSELHLGTQGSRLLRPEYREAFERDLRRLHELSGPWDLVLISGDLTQKGSTREFELLNSSLLNSLWDYFRTLGSTPSLLAVPGSRDFAGSRLGNPSLLSYSDVRESLRGSSWNRAQSLLLDGFEPFNHWLTSWRQEHPTPALQGFRTGLLPGDFSTTVMADGLKIGVIGLNSTFLIAPLASMGSRQGLHMKQLEAATVKDISGWVLQHDVLLLLTHASQEMLQPELLTQIHEKLLEPDRPFLHLCGNRSDKEWISTPRPPGWPRIIHAPSLFGDVGIGILKWGYYAGQLHLSGPHQTLRLFPRAVFTSSSRQTTATGGLIALGPDRTLPKAEEMVEISVGAPLEGLPPQKLESAVPLPQKERTWQAAALNRSPRRNPILEQIQVMPPASVPGTLPPGIRLQGVLSTGSNPVAKLTWTPDGNALGVALSAGVLAYWNPKDALRWVVSAHLSGIEDFCFSPDGQTIATRSHYNVRLWTISGTRLPPDPPAVGRGTALAWGPSGLLAAILEGNLEFWNTRSRQRAGTLSLPLGHPPVNCLNWSPDGQTLACGGEGDSGLIYWRIKVDDAGQVDASPRRTGIRGPVCGIAFQPQSSWMAVATQSGFIYLAATPYQGRSIIKLEGHTDAVTGVSFSFDGKLLASQSLDGTVRLWRTDSWEEVAQFEVPAASLMKAGPVFSPTKHTLATVGVQGCDVRIWELNVETLLRSRPALPTVHEHSAKVMLVGEGRVGKSCLALRMVHDRYEEMDSTHGMRFWTMPAERLAPDPTTKLHRELVLWDMGGQSEYQLVHQLFLRDSAVALMVMEPGRGEQALEEIDGWNQRLLAQSGSQSIRKLLVGAKMDSAESPVNLPAIESFVKRNQLSAYVSTSAKTGRGISELKAALVQAIDWSSLEQVSRPELFQRLRQHLQRLREAKRVVLTFSELESELRREFGSGFDPEVLRAVVGQLARQGLVADSRMADGTRVLILEVEQVERYAGSLIVAARDNPHGVPGLDVAKVLHPAMQFPRIPPDQRLRRDQELPVLECVIEMLLEHGLCLRHEGLLIFPSLFRPSRPEHGAAFANAISLHYDFSGPIDNIYASLITSLAISRRFGPVRLWENRAEFGRAGEDVSGVRRVKQEGHGSRGHARLEVYFDTTTPASTREVFVNFIEEHLRARGVELLERLSLTCVCGRSIAEENVRERLKLGHTDILCQVCEHRVPLTRGAREARELNPELAQQVHELSTNIRERISEEITVVKIGMAELPQAAPSKDTPLRILHLSDLHVSADTDPLSLFEPLAADLRDAREGPGVDRLDYLVISGDITNRAAPQEFEKAREFVSALIQEFGLTAERCILVPGNHDLDWDTEVYTRKKKRQVSGSTLAPGTYKEDGDGYYLRDEERYPERFKNFSQHFYHPLTQKAYPLVPEEQCIPFLFTESRLQFLAMNSAWEIDEYFTERSSISEQALARGLTSANRMRSELSAGAPLLRIAVWHHPITGHEKIQADAFVNRLLQADVRLCLHGHVHEDRADLVNYLHAERRLHVVGAGSFGVPTHHRPESVPRLFNLLEVQRDLARIRVHTRCLRKHGGAWEGWAVWPGKAAGEKRTYYDVTLP